MSEDQKKAVDYFRHVAEWAGMVYGRAALDEMAASEEGAAKYAKLYNAAYEKFFEKMASNPAAKRQAVSMIAAKVYEGARA